MMMIVRCSLYPRVTTHRLDTWHHVAWVSAVSFFPAVKYSLLYGRLNRQNNGSCSSARFLFVCLSRTSCLIVNDKAYVEKPKLA